MTADGLTKGAVDRTALHQVMAGMQTIAKEFKTWRSPLADLVQQEVKSDDMQ